MARKGVLVVADGNLTVVGRSKSVVTGMCDHCNGFDGQRALAADRALEEQLENTYQQLLQSEKMASIGQLAAGVAHEINNPVGYINSNIHSLRKYLTGLFRLIDAYCEAEAAVADPQVRERLAGLRRSLDLDYLVSDIAVLLDESQEGIGRVLKIIQAMKDFSRMDAGEWAVSDLHAGLDSTLNFVNNELKYKADIVKAYGDIPSIECILPQLNQVFMNLLVNAAQAIEGHGTVTITTGTAGDDWVWVEIADTGSGIAPENLGRLFEPFFTTKPVGKGTGLGLSVSHGIVQNHGGKIEVSSTLGKGTRFRIALPVRRTVTGDDTAGACGA